MSNTYDHKKFIGQTPWKALIADLDAASDAIVRLDERMGRNDALANGAQSRAHFREACAALWLDGELVHLEDLVLHDAFMDVRAPSTELIRAAGILRARRTIGRQGAGWPLTPAGIAILRGKKAASPLPHNDDGSTEHSEIDALIERSNQTLETVNQNSLVKLGYFIDEDWDEDGRLSEWLSVIQATEELPPLLAGAFAWDAWIAIEPLQRLDYLGLQIVAGLLRARGKTRYHLATLNWGLRAAEYRRSRRLDLTGRLSTFLRAVRAGAEAGLKDLMQLSQARRQMDIKLKGIRSNSKLPDLVDLFMSTPLVTVPVAAKTLKVSPQAVESMLKALGPALPREVTGRARYRAWGVF